MFWCILVLVAALLLEMASALLLCIATGGWYSYADILADQNALIFATEPEEARERSIHDIDFTVLHPYMGYVHDVTSGALLEPLAPFGFTKEVLQHDEDTLVIGIFGGSVAAHFSQLGGTDELVRLLQQKPAFKDKKIYVTSAALGGYKQPQHLMAYMYLLSLGAEFDYVITIDGFNEVVLPKFENEPKHVYTHYPRGWFFLAQKLQPDYQLLVGELAYTLHRRSVLAQRFHAPLLRRSYTASLLWKIADRFRSTDIADIRQRLQALQTQSDSYAVSGPSVTYEDSAAYFEDVAQMWQRSAVHMHQVSQVNGTKYYHVLQPNQYVPGSKVLTEQEMNEAYTEELPYRVLVEEGYPYLQEVGRKLSIEGVHFMDATPIFSTVSEPIYTDDCCHFSAAGHLLLAKEIAAYILANP